MKTLNNVFARIDSALDLFWKGVVLRRYHEAQAKRFSRMTTRLVQVAVKHPRIDYVSHQARRHRLEADLLQGKL